jgi:hypothetical protein
MPQEVSHAHCTAHGSYTSIRPHPITAGAAAGPQSSSSGRRARARPRGGCATPDPRRRARDRRFLVGTVYLKSIVSTPTHAPAPRPCQESRESTGRDTPHARAPAPEGEAQAEPNARGPARARGARWTARLATTMATTPMCDESWMSDVRRTPEPALPHANKVM